ncbi:HVO_2901 family zinc finger protein [Salinarchaeum laminariae]|uniref:HVO_2901 family zinc finger protein n=1 Tax=Salinarchaeum laminariae TaxID=869888 RepID=UPI0020C02CB6|nr:HVO_2901 family zinc finger protein [Salinarchaeum laminariae]
MHTCRNCNQTFSTELALELHRDVCRDGDLRCRTCGARFAEAEATTDGWHYECPEADCDGEGRGEAIVDVDRTRIERSATR